MRPVFSGCKVAGRKAYAALAQLDRVIGYEPIGQGFESLTPRQRNAFIRKAIKVFFISFFESLDDLKGAEKSGAADEKPKSISMQKSLVNQGFLHI